MTKRGEFKDGKRENRLGINSEFQPLMFWTRSASSWGKGGLKSIRGEKRSVEDGHLKEKTAMPCNLSAQRVKG